MLTTLVMLVAIFFGGMGLLALASPERIAVTFGTLTLTPAGRNEIRAVYGGFGLAMAAMIVLATRDAALETGMALTLIAAARGITP